MKNLIFFGTTEKSQNKPKWGLVVSCCSCKGEGLMDKLKTFSAHSWFPYLLERHPYPLVSYLSRSSLSSISFFSQQIPGEMPFQPSISAKCLLDPSSGAHWMLGMTQSRLLLRPISIGKRNSSQIFQVRREMTTLPQGIPMKKHSNHPTKS